MNYFILFDVPEKFEINESVLVKNFYKLQLQFHPDLFIQESELKKKMILEKSIQINQGYKILKNYISRALHLLSLRGFHKKQETFLSNEKNFLIKYFDLYEALDDLKKNNWNQKESDFFLKKIENKIENYKLKIAIEFHNQNYEKIIKIIDQLLFFRKMKINFKKEQNMYFKKYIK